jgi:type IV fimbrial biogenesis protein FimT
MNAQASAQRGFTIVELLVSLAVAAVLIGIALPAFNGLMAQRRLTSQVNDFMVAVQYARSEAAKRGQAVSIQSLDAGDGANEWGDGYCVVVGNPGDCDDPLRTFDAIGDSTLDAAGALDGRASITFNARGLMVGGGAGTVDLCDPEQTRGRRVSISLIGRVSSQELDCAP